MTLTRRGLLGAALGAPFLTTAAWANSAPVRSNISSFAMQDWRDHFDSLGTPMIVADTTSRTGRSAMGASACGSSSSAAGPVQAPFTAMSSRR